MDEPVASVWELVVAAYHRPQTRIYRWSEAFIYLLITVSIVLVVAELWIGPQDWVRPVDDAILGVFAADVFLRVATFQPPQLHVFARTPAWRLRTHIVGRLRYCLTPLMLIDILTLLAFLPALRGLRAFRLFRLLSGVRFFRHSNPSWACCGALPKTRCSTAGF